ncbi:hypothetical protein [Nocardioides daejeonensis]|nr:hypothetical protein [Nocardioides daejeonensis]
MQKFVRRVAALVVAVGLAVGIGAAPAQADTSWGYVIAPHSNVDR